ncbi:hypothetical protein ACJRO7_035067 [Eucalyptus globulus]|uniref:Uncharacterized protein n=1 Tax=Eucalyptus globulus TaxID=34317 RepID=A0ABD3J7T4_EUCGL
MASPAIPKSHFHARSVSLPSKPSPLIPQAEDHLRRIRSSKAATTCSISSVSGMISSLKDFYDFIDDLLLLPHTQQALRSLGLLDICSTGKDVAQRKGTIQVLQLALCRRWGNEMALRNEVGAYLASRKKEKKTIQNCLNVLKIKSTISSADQSCVAMVSMLREAEGIALKTIESLMTLVHGKSSRSFFSKLMHSNRVAAHEIASNRELEIVDTAVDTLLSHKSGKAILAELESHIQDLEEDMECLIRRMIETRVSPLNIHNH